MARHLIFMALLGSLLAPASSRAGIPFADCSHPPFIPSAALTVVVVPYTMGGSEAAAPAAEVSRELPLLIQSATLGLIMKYGNVASVGLTAQTGDTRCTMESVLAQLEPQLEIGQALVVVSGSLFEEEGALYIQSYLRFLRKGITEGLAFDVGAQDFEATLPRQTVVFGARKLSAADLAAVYSEFRRTSMLYEAPSDTARGRPMYAPYGPRALSYSVLETRGEWLKVATSEGLGWVRMATSPSGTSLAELLPELDWLDGVSGYLRVRQGQLKPKSDPPQHAREWVQNAFDRFAGRTTSGAPPAPAAVAQLLLGMMEYADPSASLDHQRSALGHFKQARSLEPWNSGASNLAAFASLQIDYGADSTSWRPALHERDVRQATMSSRGDSLAIRNLRNFYSLVESSRPYRKGTEHELPDSLVKDRSEAVWVLATSRRPTVTKPVKGELIDLNTATVEELRKGLKLSEIQASRIVQARPFRSLEDAALEKILGRKKLNEIAGRVTVSSRIDRIQARADTKSGGESRP